MGRKGVISSHATLYSRTERKTATQIAARSTAPISWEIPPPCLEPCANELFWVLVDQFVKGVTQGRFMKHIRGTLFSIKLHHEKIWDVEGNWKWYFLIFLGLRWPIRSYNKYWNIFFDILTPWKPLKLEERYFIHASSSNIGAIWNKSGLWDSLLRNNTPR